jgi:hypothetical protein
MKLHYVQTSDGKWHVRGLHPMGLIRTKGKQQVFFPSTGETCQECRAMLRTMHLTADNPPHRHNSGE